jgi:hypothetical protein
MVLGYSSFTCPSRAVLRTGLVVGERRGGGLPGTAADIPKRIRAGERVRCVLTNVAGRLRRILEPHLGQRCLGNRTKFAFRGKLSGKENKSGTT